ncbi:WD40 repeat-like protein [Aulographum hederae CBS 113979]|uniref:Elongator complex protein 2 n=1 Tax=Aulographum hederae CBS 113979 TaxID=1176131 RepID=A0A6G1GL85_9PEZI|nr:WD40 repeat-like protein [Aulographum hederae CBS 113979]
MSLKVDFIAAGGNRHPAAADWDPNGSGLLAFGAGNNLALWKPQATDGNGISELLRGHTDVINAVKFFPSGSSNDTIIVTGSADCTIRLWRRHGNSSMEQDPWVIDDHQDSINCIAVSANTNNFITGSADGTVKVWSLDHDSDAETPIEVKLWQTISLKPKYLSLALSLARLNDSSRVLAVAGTRSTIQIYTSEGKNFQLAASLTGHEGWIRSLAFARESEDPQSDLVLSSASQDKYIRLWRIHQGTELPAASKAGDDPILGSFGKSLSNKAHRFNCSRLDYSVTFEALLLGHEDWIYTAQWRRGPERGLELLSASADNSLAIWTPDPASGVWLSSARLGEISAQKGSTTATGSTGGFWIGLWSPSGDAVVSLGRTGSWRLWTHDTSSDSWSQQYATGGHVKEVKGIAWASDGSYLLSTSSDQTTRLFAEWKRTREKSWHEFSRPQIHGYDLNCIDTLGPHRFISGADEKLLRVFDEPKTVAEILFSLCGIEPPAASALPSAANIPVLGLSNKAVQPVAHDLDKMESDLIEDDTVQAQPSTSVADIRHPPLEDHLSRHLLFPEHEKLYGHGYEIATLAASHSGHVVATACRASSIDHAVIRLYETKEWREIRPPLTAHSLTVTSLEFSPDDKYLVSVGRDRQWAIFQRNADKPDVYELLTANPKGHSRMILGASWAPLAAGRVFATAGRDKTVKIWKLNEKEAECVASITATEPVTTVDFLQTPLDQGFCIAYGTDSGLINICCLEKDILQVIPETVVEIGSKLSPSKTVNQLLWRPLGGIQGANQRQYELAAASDDSSVRLYSFPMASLTAT